MAKRKAKKVAARAGGRRSSEGRGKLPKGAVTLIVILRAKDGQEALLEAELRALIAPTRREEGCLTYDLHSGTEASGIFMLHEVWTNREHHRRHMNTRHFLRWDARKDALLEARDATFWTQLA
jgi:quinol monooxygenase YgiN